MLLDKSNIENILDLKKKEKERKIIIWSITF